MAVSMDRLVKAFVSAMHERNAALFIGAGMSRSAGFVDWRNLMLECAQELNLDLKKEHDLVAVAQYYLNKRNRDRGRLNQILVDEFNKETVMTDNHVIISKLPVDTVWTTNFDLLLETAYRSARKRVDIKTNQKALQNVLPNRDVVLFKMHGDVARPEEIVICKDDYESYATRNQVFQNTLEGQLVQKTFLFLGFSFTDPNLEYMLGHLRSLLGESAKEHFAVMRRNNRSDYPDGAAGDEDFAYDLNKQQLQIDDLQRYHIYTLIIDDYASVTSVLSEIRHAYYMKNVFISGSASQYGRLGAQGMSELCEKLGQAIIERNLNLLSGFGLGIGSPVILGALAELYRQNKASQIGKRLTLRPFPQSVPEHERLAFNTTYRRNMLADAGFVVFVAGNKDNAAIAPGVLKEYELCRSLEKIPIPIGATGYAAEHIWHSVKDELHDVYRGLVSEATYNRLNNPGATPSQLADAALDIIDLIRDGWTAAVE